MSDHELVDRLAAVATARAACVTHLGSWEVRADPHLPFRRSNCAIPFGAPAGVVPEVVDVEARIDEVERRYRALGLDPRVQIVPSSDPADIDARLASRGYEMDAPVDLLVAELRDVVAATTDEVDDVQVVPVDIGDRVAMARLAPFGEDPAAWRRIEGSALLLAGVSRPHVALIAEVDGGLAAFGVGVLDDGWIGIFGMRTRSALRRRGAARAVLGALARHAITEGATQAYLQVEVDNAAARALYTSAGFRPSHSYHYRVLR